MTLAVRYILWVTLRAETLARPQMRCQALSGRGDDLGPPIAPHLVQATPQDIAICCPPLAVPPRCLDAGGSLSKADRVLLVLQAEPVE